MSYQLFVVVACSRTNSSADTASLVVVRRGALEGLVVIPAAAIAAVEDGVVRARLTDDELRDLERYHRED